jgi:hypothetical protein
MNILLIGGSYGVPNYYGPPGIEPEYHTEYLLKDLGHTVHNCSQNGGSNLWAIKRAETYLSGTPIGHPGESESKPFDMIQLTSPVKIDWIVWFHRELFQDYRDIADQGKQSYDTAVELLAHLTYKRFAEFARKLNAKTAVIGGCVGAVNPVLYEYIIPDFIINDWKSSILGIDLPVVQFMDLDSIDLDIDIEQKHKLVDDQLFIIRQMSQSKDFPDGGHPGIKPHADLVQQLDQLFKSN